MLSKLLCVAALTSTTDTPWQPPEGLMFESWAQRDLPQWFLPWRTYPWMWTQPSQGLTPKRPKKILTLTSAFSAQPLQLSLADSGYSSSSACLGPKGSNQSCRPTPQPGQQGSEPHLWPMLQLAARLDPSPTERGQGWNPNPHRDSVWFSNLLSHYRNSARYLCTVLWVNFAPAFPLPGNLSFFPHLVNSYSSIRLKLMNLLQKPYVLFFSTIYPGSWNVSAYY